MPNYNGKQPPIQIVSIANSKYNSWMSASQKYFNLWKLSKYNIIWNKIKNFFFLTVIVSKITPNSAREVSNIAKNLVN